MGEEVRYTQGNVCFAGPRLRRTGRFVGLYLQLTTTFLPPRFLPVVWGVLARVGTSCDVIFPDLASSQDLSPPRRSCHASSNWVNNLLCTWSSHLDAYHHKCFVLCIHRRYKSILPKDPWQIKFKSRRTS